MDRTLSNQNERENQNEKSSERLNHFEINHMQNLRRSIITERTGTKECRPNSTHLKAPRIPARILPPSLHIIPNQTDTKRYNQVKVRKGNNVTEKINCRATISKIQDQKGHFQGLQKERENLYLFQRSLWGFAETERQSRSICPHMDPISASSRRSDDTNSDDATSPPVLSTLSPSPLALSSLRLDA